MFGGARSKDTRLVLQALSGRRDAFGILVQRHLPTVYAVAYAHTGNHADAEDVAQDAFLRALQALNTLRQPRHFCAWVVGIARNAAADLRRRRARESEVLLDPKAQPSSTPDTDAEIWGRELRDLVRNEIQRLDEQEREILLLHYFAGRRTKEIAALLGLSPAATRKRLQRAREALGKRVLEQLGPDEDFRTELDRRASRITSAAFAAPIPWNVGAVAAQSTSVSAALGWAGTIGAVKSFGAFCLVVVAGTVSIWLLTRHEERPLSSADTHGIAVTPTEPQRDSPAADVKAPSRPDTGMSSVAPASKSPADTPGGTAEDRDGGTVRGRVETANGRAAAGAVVTLHRSFRDGQWITRWTGEKRSAKADESGEFAFADVSYAELPPLSAEYEVLACTKDGLAKKHVSLDKETHEKDIVLRLEPAERFSGKVVDRSGAPVIGAEVYPAERQGRGSIIYHLAPAMAVATGQEGVFLFPALWLGQWQFHVRADGYATQTTSFFPLDGPEPRIVLAPEAEAVGRVLEADSRAPVEGIEVKLRSPRQCDNAETTTNQQGEFRFGSLGNGAYALHLQDDFWAPIGGLREFTLRNGRSIGGLDLRVCKGAVVSGRVYDADTGEGVAGIRVMLFSTEAACYRQGWTDADGYYRVAGLAEGAYQVRRDRFVKGYPFPEEKWEPELSVIFGQEVTGYDILMSKGLSISGKIVDGQGVPLGGVQLRTFVTQERHQYEHSEPDGSFTLTGYRPGDEVVIHAEHGGYATLAHGPIDMAEDNVENVVITMEPAAAVEGIVVDGQGRPIPYVRLFPLPQFETMALPSMTTTGYDGSFVCDKLPSGRYEIHVEAKDKSEPMPTGLVIELAGGQRISGLRVVYSKEDGHAEGGWSISGRVTDINGHPLPAASIAARGGGSGLAIRVETDEDGYYVLSGLDYVTYRVTATSDGERASAEVSAGSEGVDFVIDTTGLRDGEIDGRVLRADTHGPVADFEVKCISWDDEKDGAFVRVHNDEGRFRLRQVGAGERAVFVKAPGFVAWQWMITVKPLEEGPTEILVELEPAATISGTVVDVRGAPVTGASVFLAAVPTSGKRASPAARSNAEGAFRLEQVNPRGQLISITHEDHAPYTGFVAPPRRESQICFTLAKGGTVEGVVRYAGRPAGNSFLWVHAPNLGIGGMFSGQADAKGMYKIDGVPEGPVRVGARLANDHAGLDTNTFHQSRDALVADARVTRVDFEFEPPTASLEGTVTADGRPADARVRLYVDTLGGELQMATTADLAGNYRFDAVPAGRSTLNVSKEGRATVVPVLIAEGEAVHQDIDLKGACALSVRVTGVRAEECVRVEVYAGDVGPVADRAATESLYRFHCGGAWREEDGFYRVSGLCPGVYTVAVLATPTSDANVWVNGRSALALVEVTHAPETVVRLVLK